MHEGWTIEISEEDCEKLREAMGVLMAMKFQAGTLEMKSPNENYRAFYRRKKDWFKELTYGICGIISEYEPVEEG